MPDLFLDTAVIIEKTTAQKIIESMPKPMQPIVDPSTADGIGSLKDSQLYKFLHKLCGPFIDKFPQELKEMFDGSTLYTSSGFWLEMYGAGFGVFPKPDEEEASFKSRIMNEMFRAKISNKAIKIALQEFSSTEVFVLDRLAVAGGGTGSSGGYVLPSLPFLSIDQQDIRAGLTANISITDTAVFVTDTSKFPLKGFGLIDNEIVYFEKIDSTSLTITRSQKNTSASQHLIGSYISIYKDVFSLFLDFFNVLNDVDIDPDGDPVIAGAFEFDVYITPYPDNDNTRAEILNIIDKFKAAGTKAYLRSGLPYNL